jgi:hypothetical protein
MCLFFLLIWTSAYSLLCPVGLHFGAIDQMGILAQHRFKENWVPRKTSINHKGTKNFKYFQETFGFYFIHVYYLADYLCYNQLHCKRVVGCLVVFPCQLVVDVIHLVALCFCLSCFVFPIVFSCACPTVNPAAIVVFQSPLHPLLSQEFENILQKIHNKLHNGIIYVAFAGTCAGKPPREYRHRSPYCLEWCTSIE